MPRSIRPAAVELTVLLFLCAPDNSIKFAIAHELGHVFSVPLLARLGLGALSGCPTEVIADRGAAYTLNLLGLSWNVIRQITKEGSTDGIFDPDWNGDHPPGYMRAHAICSLADLIEHHGESFDDAAAAITLSMQGMENRHTPR